MVKGKFIVAQKFQGKIVGRIEFPPDADRIALVQMEDCEVYMSKDIGGTEDNKIGLLRELRDMQERMNIMLQSELMGVVVPEDKDELTLLKEEAECLQSKQLQGSVPSP